MDVMGWVVMSLGWLENEWNVNWLTIKVYHVYSW
jgi:hypothetical protein